MQSNTLVLVTVLATAGLAAPALAQQPAQNVENTTTVTENNKEQNTEQSVNLIGAPSPGEKRAEEYRLAGLPAFDIIQNISSSDSCLDREGDALRLKNCKRTTPTRWVNDGSRLRPKTGPLVDGSKCLTTDASRKVVLTSCVTPSSPGQQWDLDTKTGWITSRLVKGACLTTPHAMLPCGAGPSQVWRASDQYIRQEAQSALKAAATPKTTPAQDIVVTTPTVNIVAMGGPGLCVGGALNAGAQAELVACQSGNGHEYIIRTFSSGHPPITRFELFDSANNRSHGLCLDVRGGSPQQGTPVQLHACNTSNAQKWTQIEQVVELIAGNAASRMHTSVGPNLCLDAAGGELKAGAKLVIWVCHAKADNQNFRVGSFR